jgi:hypothetical protein
MVGRVRRGQDRRGIGADREEAGDAGVEQPGEAPLDVEAERQHGVEPAHGEQADQIHAPAIEAAAEHQNTRPRNRPVGRQISIATISVKATAVL